MGDARKTAKITTGKRRNARKTLEITTAKTANARVN
jgi:hypothetical protein